MPPPVPPPKGSRSPPPTAKGPVGTVLTKRQVTLFPCYGKNNIFSNLAEGMDVLNDPPAGGG